MSEMLCQCRTDLHPFVSRWTNISTPYPTLVNSEQRVANLYPWWAGHWPEDRNKSYSMPKVIYPGPQWPRGVLDASKECDGDFTICQSPLSQQCLLLTPNWAFPTRR